MAPVGRVGMRKVRREGTDTLADQGRYDQNLEERLHHIESFRTALQFTSGTRMSAMKPCNSSTNSILQLLPNHVVASDPGTRPLMTVVVPALPPQAQRTTSLPPNAETRCCSLVETSSVFVANSPEAARAQGRSGGIHMHSCRLYRLSFHLINPCVIIHSVRYPQRPRRIICSSIKTQ